MATDYDAPRKTEDEHAEDSIEELKARRHEKSSGKVDEDEAEAAGVFGVPSFLLDDGDLYWGREHLPRIRELLAS